MSEIVLSLQAVTKRFKVGRHEVEAVADVSLDIIKGECLALVGESGSGKSTIAGMILGISPPSAGSILFRGATLPARRDKSHRRAIQLVQQNPLSSLNPKRSIAKSLRLPLDVHDLGARASRPGRIAELLDQVGLSPAMSSRAPSALSGGQRQRVAIARALACEPDLIVLDEPTSALDVLVQARILGLLGRLRTSLGLTYLFISHDLCVVRNIADRVAVLQKGRIVEVGAVEQIFSTPRHAYTRALLAAVPVVTAEEQDLRDRLSAGVAG